MSRTAGGRTGRCCWSGERLLEAVLIADDADEVLRHVYRLWKFPVSLESVWQDEVQLDFRVPQLSASASGSAYAGMAAPAFLP